MNSDCINTSYTVLPVDSQISLEETLIEARENEGYIGNRDFSNEAFSRLDLSYLELEAVTFSNCRFMACDFSHTTLKQVTFNSCDLSGCTFIGGYWQQSTLKLSKAEGSDFNKCGFRWTHFEKNILPYTCWVETFWEHCTIDDCVMREAFLSEVKFKKTALSNTDLNRAEFFRTPLRDIDLSSCIIDGITLSDSHTELHGALVSPIQAVELAKMLGVRIAL